jgi:hypothetical protein
VRHRHLATNEQWIFDLPEWRGQAWIQQALRCARVAHLGFPETPPWPSVIFDYGRPPALPPEPGNIYNGLILSQSVLGSGPGVATAAELLGQALAPTASTSYQHLWDNMFERFCASAARRALPASPATVTAYLDTLFDGGRMCGSFFRPYVTAIGAQHRRLALADPTAHTLVAMAPRLRHGRRPPADRRVASIRRLSG